MVSQPRAERRGCCALAGVDRLTREGGDCCKTLQLADGEDVSQTSVALEVPVAMVALGGAAAVVVDEGVQRFGATGEIASVITENAFDYLDAPVARIGAADLPIPFSPSLEMPTIPDTARVVAAVKSQRA